MIITNQLTLYFQSFVKYILVLFQTVPEYYSLSASPPHLIFTVLMFPRTRVHLCISTLRCRRWLCEPGWFANFGIMFDSYLPLPAYCYRYVRDDVRNDPLVFLQDTN